MIAVVIAAATVSAVPVTEIETAEEFGAIKSSIANFASWLKGKECRMQSCPAHCERKYRLAWGRRLLSAEELNDSDETEAAIRPTPRPSGVASRRPSRR